MIHRFIIVFKLKILNLDILGRFIIDIPIFLLFQDIKSPNEPLPTKAGIVTTKILRLDTASCLKRKTNLRLKANIKYAESSELPQQVNPKKDVQISKPAAVKRDIPESQRKQQSAGPEPKGKTSKQPEQQTAPPVRKQRPEVKEGNLLDGDDEPVPQRTPAPEKPSARAIVEPPAPTPAPIVEPVAKPPTPPPLEPVLSREELAAKREALVQEQVDAALKEKREVL